MTQGNKSSNALIAAGIAASVMLVGCGSGPVRPPMPDMSSLVAVNQDMPSELRSGPAVQARPLPPARTQNPPVAMDVGLRDNSRIYDLDNSLAADNLSSRFALSTPSAAAPKVATPSSPRLFLYDAILARRGATVTAIPDWPDSSDTSVESSAVADESEVRTAPDAQIARRMMRELEQSAESDVGSAPSSVADRDPVGAYRVLVAPALAVAGFIGQGSPDAVDAVDRSPAPAPEPEALASTAPRGVAVEKSMPAPAGADAEGREWHVEPGLFRQQALRWGRDDPDWDVHWLAPVDPEIQVPYTFHGSLDEVLIQAVRSLASSGAPIRIERARANQQLIIRSTK